MGQKSVPASRTAQVSGHVRVHMRWWFKPYLWGVATVAMLTGREPDWDRVGRVSTKATKVRVH